MFNKILDFSQKKTVYLYENSLILQNIDGLIFLSICAVFLLSTFMVSDTIGFCALVCGFLTVVKLFTKSGERISCRGFEIWLLAYFMLVIVSLFGASLFILSLKGFFKTLTYLIFYSSVVIYLKDNKEKIPFFMGLIGLCLGSQAIVGILQNFSQVNEISTWQDVSRLNPEQVMTRVYGTLKPYNPNLLGGYLLIGTPSVFGVSAIKFFEKKKYLGLFWLLVGGLIVAATFLTGCRGAYLGVFGGFLAVILISFKFFWKQYKKAYLSIIGGCLTLITTAILLLSSLRARIISIFAMRSDSSNSFRFNVYNSSLQMFKDNWLLGIGLGNQNFREIYGLYMITGFDALSAYNIFLETAVESGIFALIAFVGFFACIIYQGVKFIVKSDDMISSIIISTVVISTFVTAIHGMVDTVFFRPQLQFVFWFMIATGSVILNSKDNNKLSPIG